MVELSIQELIALYETAEEEWDFDTCQDLEDVISRKKKNLEEMKVLFDWRVREFLQGDDMPPFTLEYHDGHPEYDYNEEHFHIEIAIGCFLSQWDLKYLIEEELRIILHGYASFSGEHIHFFETAETMNKMVKDLNILFELDHLMS